MEPGAVVADRFRIEKRAAVGGMADVYRAIDSATAAPVALKVPHPGHEDRFAREVSILASLSHPGIVRHVAHGAAPRPYLAMEWIEGESLARRLARGPLPVDDAVALATRIADALASAHAGGVVHRDVTPSNLLLAAGDVAGVRLIDFGIAAGPLASPVVTLPGAVAGTPGYLAPEQARGLVGVDARADVYSLGCVLFECLTGRRVFPGQQVFAVLAKILLEPPPRPSELGAVVPDALDALVERMLAKAPADRPVDAAAVRAALSQALVAAAPAPRALGGGEQRVVCVILATASNGGGGAVTATLPPVAATPGTALDDGVAAAVASSDGVLERLPGGDVVVTLGGAGAATDLAARAARCALAIARLRPSARIALATGRGVAGGRRTGPAIDEAARLLGDPAPAPEGHTRPVRVDRFTAGLLDARFELEDAAGGAWLLGYAADREGLRPLLGVATPFVGRDRELGQLLSAFDDACAEQRAHAVLITGPSGAGKSRLRAELVRHLQDRPGTEVWLGRGDPMSAGAPLALLAQMVKRQARIVHGEPASRSRRKLLVRVGRHVPALQRGEVAAFIGEMCGVPFDDRQRPSLRAARRDTAMLGDQMRRAWEVLIGAECAAGPRVLVLEDLHWGDLPTVRFVDTVLRVHARRPLVVLALARPEVQPQFPGLWSGRNLEVIPLRPLADQACRRLVTEVLGPDTSPTLVERIADRAGGNPFTLEELVRAAATGAAVPGTVLSMVGARLETLAPDRRRLLRLASLIGESFWAGELAALAGDASPAILDELVDGEWLSVRGDASYTHEREYVFRHALVREAAYAMLTDADRRAGHALLASWLASHRRGDPLAIAEHFERGDDLGHASAWYARAAQYAFGGTDLRAAIDLARRGLACAARAPGTSAEDVGRLRAVLVDAYQHAGHNAEAEDDGLAAMELLPAGSSTWFLAAGQVATAAGRLGHHDRLLGVAESLYRAVVTDRARPAWLRAGTIAAERLILARHGVALADALLERLEREVGDAAAADPALPARLLVARSYRMVSQGNLSASLDARRTAVAMFERLGDHRRACTVRHEAGYASLELGAWQDGEELLRQVLVEAEGFGMTMLQASARLNLSMAQAHRGALDDAETLVRAALAEFEALRNRRLEASAHEDLARILALGGRLDEAEDHARCCVDLAEAAGVNTAEGPTVLAEVLLRAGRADEALVVARRACAALDGIPAAKEESRTRLVLAECLAAAGAVDESRRVIAAARDRLLGLAEKIGDARLRASYLAEVPENARTLQLAKAWA